MRIRCYLAPDQWGEGLISLGGSEAHHIIHVLRVTPGLRLTCFNGLGLEADAVVDKVGKRDLVLRLGPSLSQPGPSWQVTLGVAVPRNAKIEQIIDQATQLGVSRIIPLATTRGVVKIRMEERTRKQKRWQQAAVEAGKQSGVDRLPSVDAMTNWRQILPTFKQFDLVLLAAVEGPHEPLQKLLAGAAIRKVLVLIGPEGDFSPEEITQAVQQGARRFSLGKNILRVDTAAVAAVTLVSYGLGERGSEK